MRRVKRWAKRLRLEPACSKAPQKSVANTNSTITAPMRLRSIGVRPWRTSHTKKTAVPPRIKKSL
jgi:hypothetical protein